jgi:glutaredoxin
MKQCLLKVSIALLAIGVVVSAGAQGMYRWEDKNGRVTYSDTPPPKDAKTQTQKKLGDNIIEQEKLPFATKAAQEKNPVTLYVTNCGEPCTAARALLSKRGIPFSEKNPAADPAAAVKLKEVAGDLDVPTMTIGSNAQKGFLESAWSAALDSAGDPKTNAVLGPAQATARAATPAPTTPAKK